MIVSHIDPPHLFARPIFIASFFAAGHLAFGAGFTFEAGRFDQDRSSPPKFLVELPRGSLCRMEGFAADGITHGIRPVDIPGRRASIVLRHVLESAPKVSLDHPVEAAKQTFYSLTRIGRLELTD